MLSENAIDNLIQPIIDRQEKINMYVLLKLARRIKELGKLLPSDLYKLERLLKTGSDVREINQELARLSELQVKDIKAVIKEIALDSYLDTKPFYDYRHKSFIPFEKNVELQRVVKAVEQQTIGIYKNLSKSQAFMIRDLKNPKILKPTSLSRAYQSVIDEAVQASQQGTIDYNTAMKRTIKQLVASGIREVEYNPESGRRYTQRLDAAVRRNILDGIRAVNQAVQDETGKQFGADGKEITVHKNSAPDHEPVQGRQFTNEEFEKLQNEESFKDVNGKTYEPIQRAIGTLNCRHFTYSIIIGEATPNYTEEELEEMAKENAKGYTDSKGRHYTMYECTQHQRELERQIRELKEGQRVAEEAGNADLAKEYKAKVKQKLAEYKAFSEACGLKPKMERTQI